MTRRRFIHSVALSFFALLIPIKLGAKKAATLTYEQAKAAALKMHGIQIEMMHLYGAHVANVRKGLNRIFVHDVNKISEDDLLPPKT